MDEVYQEISIMKKLNHPNIMKLHEVIDCPLSPKLYLIMPVADYGECMSFNGSQLNFIPNPRLSQKKVNKIKRS